jgi:hypothetical protein
VRIRAKLLHELIVQCIDLMSTVERCTGMIHIMSSHTLISLTTPAVLDVATGIVAQTHVVGNLVYIVGHLSLTIIAMAVLPNGSSCLGVRD